jgi:hypothetical protein
MLEFGVASMLKVARGHMCIEEIFRVIPAEHNDSYHGFSEPVSSIACRAHTHGF